MSKEVKTTEQAPDINAQANINATTTIGGQGGAPSLGGGLTVEGRGTDVPKPVPTGSASSRFTNGYSPTQPTQPAQQVPQVEASQITSTPGSIKGTGGKPQKKSSKRGAKKAKAQQDEQSQQETRADDGQQTDSDLLSTILNIPSTGGGEDAPIEDSQATAAAAQPVEGVQEQPARTTRPRSRNRRSSAKTAAAKTAATADKAATKKKRDKLPSKPEEWFAQNDLTKELKYNEYYPISLLFQNGAVNERTGEVSRGYAGKLADAVSQAEKQAGPVDVRPKATPRNLDLSGTDIADMLDQISSLDVEPEEVQQPSPHVITVRNADGTIDTIENEITPLISPESILESIEEYGKQRQEAVPQSDEDRAMLADLKSDIIKQERIFDIQNGPVTIGMEISRKQQRAIKEGDEKTIGRVSRKLRKELDRSVTKSLLDKIYEKDEQDQWDPNRWRPSDLMLRTIRRMQHKMMRMFANAWSIHIEGEYIETYEDNGKVYARMRWKDSDKEEPNPTRVSRIEQAFSELSKLYGGASWYHIMQLVILRGGIGIDIHGKIAGVDPDDFVLKEDIFLELCRDIIASQKKYDHPLALVPGIGGSPVRDDSGKFVVMAGTRCYPVGYMPESLIRALTKDPRSALYWKPKRQWGPKVNRRATVKSVQELIAHTWINDTSRELLTQSHGNSMRQLYALENQVRAMAMIDGNEEAVSNLKLHTTQVNESLLQMRGERAVASDKHVIRALDERSKRLSNDASRWLHRFMKGDSVIDENGNVVDTLTRKASTVEDVAHGTSTLQKAAKSANLMLWISSPFEAAQGMLEESAGNWIANHLFSTVPREVAKDYAVTDTLQSLANSASTVEAYSVLCSLYRIGGWTAINAYLADIDDAGRMRNRLTYANLRLWLQETGVIGTNTVSDRVRQMFGVAPGQEAGFLANAQGVIDGIEDVLLGSSQLFKGRVAAQFIKQSMAEMAMFKTIGRESFTSKQVEQWGLRGGGEELVRSLIQTDAGTEAFMTQGITSLGRKSYVEHAMRRIMSANGVTEFVIRTMFDRFPEYGVQKILRQIPLSNTLSYIGSYGITGLGDFMAGGKEDAGALVSALQRAGEYQAGRGYNDFFVGLRKMLIYDSVMACNKLVVALIVHVLFNALGGLHEPPDKRDRWTYSEWILGDDENSVPLKWAWWTDDLMGISLPLAVAMGIMQQGGNSPESRQDAAAVFMNAIANFNDGTALFEAIDFVTHTEQYFDDALGVNVDAYDPTFDERARAAIIITTMDFFGDLTPTVIGQLIPWSRDFVFSTDEYKHTASRVYDDSYMSMEEAQERNKTVGVGDYVDYKIRHETANNWLAGLFMDIASGAFNPSSGVTSYRYRYMPIGTRTDPYDMSSGSPYMRFYLDTSIESDDLPPVGTPERTAALDASAEEVLDYIRRYDSPQEAVVDGFALNFDQIQNCFSYCQYQYKKLEEQRSARKEAGEFIPEDEWNSYSQRIAYYKTLCYEWFGSDTDIPMSPPRYLEQETDYETRYVDENGNAATYLDYLRGNARAERYAYGNQPNDLMPFTSPRTAGKSYNFETPTYHAFVDENGVPHGDVEQLYDNAMHMKILMGRGSDPAQSTLETMWGGQGNNLADTVFEDLNIERGGVPTIDERNWVIDTRTLPDSLWDDENIASTLGINPSDRGLSTGKGGDKGGSDTSKVMSGNPDDYVVEGDGSGGGNSQYGYGGGYSYYTGGGGGYHSYYSGGGSSYTPRIYSTSGDVYSSRPSGMGVRTPYKPTSTYLRPSYSTKGSREAYRRNDL